MIFLLIVFAILSRFSCYLVCDSASVKILDNPCVET